MISAASARNGMPLTSSNPICTCCCMRARSSAVKGPGFQKNTVGDPELSDIVQIGSPGETSELFVRPAHRSGNHERVATDPLRVARGLAITEIDRRAKRLQGVLIARRDLLESRLKLRGALHNHLFKMLAIAFDLLLEGPLMFA